MPESRVRWVSDLVRLEIVLWNHLDARLRERHGLSLAFFEALHAVSAAGGSLRVGDLASALRVSVGGVSKLVDRVEAAGLLVREADPDDRRAARARITTAGKRKLTAATKTYEPEAAACLDPALSAKEQEQMHDYVQRLLASADSA
jgi:DNA-binding MarR family transcriptional regulator